VSQHQVLKRRGHEIIPPQNAKQIVRFDMIVGASTAQARLVRAHTANDDKMQVFHLGRTSMRMFVLIEPGPRQRKTLWNYCQNCQCPISVIFFLGSSVSTFASIYAITGTILASSLSLSPNQR